MIQIGAFHTQGALLALEPNEVSPVQLFLTFPADRAFTPQDKHDQVLALFGAGHGRILHLSKQTFNLVRLSVIVRKVGCLSPSEGR